MKEARRGASPLSMNTVEGIVHETDLSRHISFARRSVFVYVSHYVSILRTFGQPLPKDSRTSYRPLLVLFLRGVDFPRCATPVRYHYNFDLSGSRVEAFNALFTLLLCSGTSVFSFPVVTADFRLSSTSSSMSRCKVHNQSCATMLSIF